MRGSTQKHPEGAGAVTGGEIRWLRGATVFGGEAFAFGALAGAVDHGGAVEFGAIGGEEEGAAGGGELEGGVEEVFEVELDLPAAAVVAVGEGGGIEHDHVEALAFAIEVGQCVEGVGGEETMAGGGEVVEGEVLFAASEGFFGEIDVDGFGAGEGGGDAETAGVGEGVEKAFGA